MIILAFTILGACSGALIARRRKGNKLDMAQYAAGYGIAFLILGFIITVVIERTFT